MDNSCLPGQYADLQARNLHVSQELMPFVSTIQEILLHHSLIVGTYGPSLHMLRG